MLKKGPKLPPRIDAQPKLLFISQFFSSQCLVLNFEISSKPLFSNLSPQNLELGDDGFQADQLTVGETKVHTNFVSFKEEIVTIEPQRLDL